MRNISLNLKDARKVVSNRRLDAPKPYSGCGGASDIPHRWRYSENIGRYSTAQCLRCDAIKENCDNVPSDEVLMLSRSEGIR